MPQPRVVVGCLSLVLAAIIQQQSQSVAQQNDKVWVSCAGWAFSDSECANLGNLANVNLSSCESSECMHDVFFFS